MEIVQAAVLMVLSILLPLGVQWRDKGQLDEAGRGRSWNTASWGSALLMFGTLSLLGWYWVTRRGWRRFVYGPLSTSLVNAAVMLLGLLLEGLTRGLTAEAAGEALALWGTVTAVSLLVPPLVWLVQRLNAVLRG